MSEGARIPPPRTYRGDIGLRTLATVSGGLGALVLASAPVSWPLGIAGWALIGLVVGAAFWSEGRRRLELHADRLVLRRGGGSRVVRFREIEAWAIPLGTTLVLTLAGGERLGLSRWRKQADMNAAIVTAIRVAGSTFDKAGAVNRVRWS